MSIEQLTAAPQPAPQPPLTFASEEDGGEDELRVRIQDMNMIFRRFKKLDVAERDFILTKLHQYHKDQVEGV